MVEGYILRRQTEINDSLMVNHLTAGKIAEAVWGSRAYSKPFKDVALIKDEDYYRNKAIEMLKSKGVL